MSKVIKYGSIREENRAAAEAFAKIMADDFRRYCRDYDDLRIPDIPDRLLDAIEGYAQGRLRVDIVRAQTEADEVFRKAIKSAEDLIGHMRKLPNVWRDLWGDLGRPGETEWLPDHDTEIDFIHINVIRRAQALMDAPLEKRPPHRMEDIGMRVFIAHMYQLYKDAYGRRPKISPDGPFLRFCNDWLDVCTIDGDKIKDQVKPDKANTVEERLRAERG